MYQLDCSRIKSPAETESLKSWESHFSVANSGCLGSKFHFLRASLQLRHARAWSGFRNFGLQSLYVMHSALP